MPDKFILHANYKPTGDQPQAIDALVQSIHAGHREQTLLGVTGSGKTFTMANIIEKVNRPTLVLAHNKTLAAQLCTEFKEFFPENAVGLFRILSIHNFVTTKDCFFQFFDKTNMNKHRFIIRLILFTSSALTTTTEIPRFTIIS